MNLKQCNPVEVLDLLDGILESMSTAVFIIRENYKVTDGNQAFRESFQVNLNHMEGFGDIISCVNASKSDQNCGETMNCAECQFHRALEKTLRDKVSVESFKASRTVYLNGQLEKRHFKMSTRYCQISDVPCVLVMVEDITKDEENRLELEKLYKTTQLNEMKLSEKVTSQTKEITRITMSMINALENANYYNDTDTGNHIRRVCKYSALFARAYGCSDEFVEKIELYASLHDVGKVGISDGLLKKKGRYTKPEWESMQNHVVIGAKMIESAQLDDMAVNIVKYHHEWFDGSGYKYKLKGMDIPLEARIVALADVYDALSTKRSYKEAYSDEMVDRIILESSGTQFDPDLVEVFFRLKDEVLKIKNTYVEDDVSKINSEVIDGIRVINLVGRVTFDHVDELTFELDRISMEKTCVHRGQIINLKSVQTIDSVGLGFLIRLQKSFHGQCCLVSDDEFILELLDVFNMDELFKIFADMKSARKFLNG